MVDNLREKSRLQWVNPANTNDQIQLGAILRIADATEAMAKHHNNLIEKNKFLMRSNERLLCENNHLKRSNSALKGHISRLKRKLEVEKNNEPS